MKGSCNLQIGCEQCGVNLNPWLVHQYQSFAQENGLPVVKGLNLNHMTGLCESFKPETLYDQPSQPILDDNGEICGYASPAFDPACPESGSGMFGGVLRSVVIEDGSELTGSRSKKFEPIGCTQRNGVKYGTAIVEIVGTNTVAVCDYFEWMKSHLESIGEGCCSTTIDYWKHCCNLDGKTGRRTLTDVRGWLVRETDEHQAATDCGLMVEILFAAAGRTTEPDAEIIATEADTFDAIRPYCPTTTTEMRPTTTEKTACIVELCYDVATATLEGCPTNCDTFDPATQYIDFATTITRKEVDEAECCPIEFSLLDTTTSPPTLVAAQQPLFDTQIAAPLAAGEGIDCTCAPVIKNVRYNNPGYNPACGCPKDPFECAEELGLAVEDGFLVIPAPNTGDTFSIQDDDPADQAVFAQLAEFMKCLGLTTPDIYNNPPFGPDPQPGDCVAFQIAQIRINPETGCYQFGILSGEACIAPGVSSETWTPDANQIPGTCDSLATLTTECNQDTTPDHCKEKVTVPPIGGGPCVIVTLDEDAAVDSLTYELNGLPVLPSDDLSTASFKFAPCIPTAEDESCPDIIPTDAPLVGTLTDGKFTFETDGSWIIGPSFPGSTDGSNLNPVSVNGVANSSEPITTMGEVPVAANETVAGCEPPCGSEPVKAPKPVAIDCFDDCNRDDNVRVIVRKLDGLNPRRTYRPRLCMHVNGTDPLDHVEYSIITIPKTLNPPGPKNIGMYWKNTNPKRIKQLPPGACLTQHGASIDVTCGGECFDGGAGWVVPGAGVFGDQLISCTDCAWLIMFIPTCVEEPTIELTADCLV